MAAPREVPILLGIFVALAAMVGHVVAVRIEQASPRPERPRVALLAPEARAPSSMDTLLMVGTGVVGLAGLSAQVLSRRARLLHALDAKALPPRERGMLMRRAGSVLALWAGFSALSLAFMLRRPPEERLHFIVPCVLLLLPARVYVRYRDGEAAWAPWLMGLAGVVLAVTREPKYTWGLLLIAGVCQLCALRQEHAKRAELRASASRGSRNEPS